MPIEGERLRTWVYEALIRPRQELGLPNHQALHLNNISGWVRRRAQESGLLPQNSLYQNASLEKAHEDAIRECIWGLVIQGIVVPGTSNDSSHQSNFPWFEVTQWGRACLEKGEYVPYDTGVFLSRLKNQISNLDPITDLYVREALNSFRSGNYLAVAVMTGVASERILLILRDAICG